jgi:hypothetical protein
MKTIEIENLFYDINKLTQEVEAEEVTVSLTTTFSKRFDFYDKKKNLFDIVEKRLALFETLKSLEKSGKVQKLEITPQVEKYVLFLKQLQKFNNKYLDGQNLLSSEQILNEGFENYCKEQESWV